MNRLRIIPRLFHSSERQLFQTVCLTITWKQANKDYKEELVDVLCFFNMTSAMGRKVVLIPDYLHSLSIYSYFSSLIRGTKTYFDVTPKMCFLSRIFSELSSAQNVKFIRFTIPKQNYVILTNNCL